MRHVWMIAGLALAVGMTDVAQRAQASSAQKDRGRTVTQAKDGVRLEIRHSGDAQTMDVYNDLDMPVSVVISVTNAVNMTGVRSGPIHRSIPPRSKVRMATLRKRDTNFPMIYRHSFNYAIDYSPNPGEAGPVVGPAYELPWQGGPFRISQGAGGDFSHNSPKGRFAVDVAMPVGTPIIAARGGKVLAVNNNQAGRLPNAGGNFVRILHEDGTHGAYLHLQRGSVAVKPGDRVEAGELLGKSGNTGRSTGPHLHFVVQKEIEGSLVSIPFRFRHAVGGLPNFARMP
ncbi:M23 family metallopeptidase [Stutzerimonas tarimensis]|uniref:M23 family metallopeptidase n=1 Tax=Stutzerimonas tarimensis TaxID=1507735 RepID=A0ABV7T2G7_9GAMM